MDIHVIIFTNKGTQYPAPAPPTLYDIVIQHATVCAQSYNGSIAKSSMDDPLIGDT